jgi:phosphotransferase system IIB component
MLLQPMQSTERRLTMRLMLSGIVLFTFVTLSLAADRVRPAPPTKGVVEKVDATGKTITIKTQSRRTDATSLTVTVNDQTKYTKQEIKPGERGIATEAKLADVTVGKNVEIAHVAKDGKNIASSVKILGGRKRE